MFRVFRDFLRRDLGQDLAEYCLLLAFLCLVAAGILLHVSGGIQNLWTSAGTTIQAGSTASNGATQQSGAATQSR